MQGLPFEVYIEGSAAAAAADLLIGGALSSRFMATYSSRHTAPVAIHPAAAAAENAWRDPLLRQCGLCGYWIAADGEHCDTNYPTQFQTEAYYEAYGPDKD